MKRQDADKLRPLVTDLGVSNALEHYVHVRMEALKDMLVGAPNMDFVIRIQGAIDELKRFRNLRDEVLNAKE